MKLKYNAISFVMKKGRSHHKMRVLIALGRRDKNFQRLLREFIESQNSDGGWSWLGRWPFDERRPSSTYDTAYILDLLLEAGQDRDSEVVQRAVTFLFKMQRPDGGWSESPEVSKAIKREWIWYSTKSSITWVTASIMSVLTAAGYGTDPRIKKALDYLRRMQNEEGGWPSHEEAPRRTDMWAIEAIIEAFIKAGEAKDSPLIRKALESIVKHRERWREPVENPLGVFINLGYGLEHPYIQECVSNLISSQHEDGGWGFYNDWPSHPDQTSTWIRYMAKLKAKVDDH